MTSLEDEDCMHTSTLSGSLLSVEQASKAPVVTAASSIITSSTSSVIASLICFSVIVASLSRVSSFSVKRSTLLVLQTTLEFSDHLLFRLQARQRLLQLWSWIEPELFKSINKPSLGSIEEGSFVQKIIFICPTILRCNCQ